MGDRDLLKEGKTEATLSMEAALRDLWAQRLEKVLYALLRPSLQAFRAEWGSHYRLCSAHA